MEDPKLADGTQIADAFTSLATSATEEQGIVLKGNERVFMTFLLYSPGHQSTYYIDIEFADQARIGEEHPVFIADIPLAKRRKGKEEIPFCKLILMITCIFMLEFFY